MRAIAYAEGGDPDVLRLVEREIPQPGPGEVRVAVAVSGVNPTDWKARRTSDPLPFELMVPGQDGAGVVDAVGPGVDAGRIGERVWLWEAAWQRAEGTSQEYVTLPSRQAVVLPEPAPLELGASIGIPALTAHRCLTTYEGSDGRLGPGSLRGRRVLVAGGAGAVGNAAIQLARWAGATVLTTVSSVEKARLARAAGAEHVINYHTDDAASMVRAVAPDGVDIIVELAPGANEELDHSVLARAGVIAVYAAEGALTVPGFPSMVNNTRYQFVLVYTVPREAKLQAVHDVSEAVAVGALRVGEEAGLPLHRYPLEQAAAAHAAVESGAVGKVLIHVNDKIQ
jgi:NADPH2:quinone reductase